MELQVKNQKDLTPILGNENHLMMMTPPIGDDYWTYRVKLSDKQAIIGFPKFSTIGISFEKEEDWNTNLPFSCPAEEIFGHIKINKGDDSILDEDCIKAIRMIQDVIIAVRLQILDVPEDMRKSLLIAAAKGGVKL